MQKRNQMGITHASRGGSSWVGGGCGHSGSERSGRGLRSAEEESDGEGGQPLGGGGCGIGSVKLGGTMGNELSGGTVAPRRNDS